MSTSDLFEVAITRESTWAWAIGVLCGFGEKDELERAGAHLIVPSPADLPSVLLNRTL